jgi:hypothetical protein
MAESRCPRDLHGYGRNPPDPHWPGQARVAVQFVVNFEESGENNLVRLLPEADISGVNALFGLGPKAAPRSASVSRTNRLA